MKPLKDKTALVTGGGTGIGKAIAYEFSKAGCQVVIASRQYNRLRQTAEDITQSTGVKVTPIPVDITQPADVDALFSKTLALFDGKLDILINNSGAFDGAPIDQVTNEQWNRVIDVNVSGVFYCMREAFKVMKKQNSGKIVNIGSIAAFRPRKESTPYSTSKSAIIGLTNAAALEGREFGISVSALHPGNVMVERRHSGSSQTGQDTAHEVMIQTKEIAKTALLIVTLPRDTNILETVILPLKQEYIGRG